jgi:hypothetical protein
MIAPPAITNLPPIKIGIVGNTRKTMALITCHIRTGAETARNLAKRPSDWAWSRDSARSKAPGELG